MKKVAMLNVLLTLLLAGACITMRTRKVDDGSTTLSKEDSLKIFPFSISQADMKNVYSAQKEIVFQVINTDELKRIIPQKKYTWLLIGSSWCPVCQRVIKQYSSLIKEYPRDSIQLILVCQDMNIPVLQSEIFESDYRRMPYLMDPKKYGSDEVFKQEKFIRDLDPKLPLAFFKGGGVPVNLMLDQHYNVLFMKHGDLISHDTIWKYTHLKRIL